MNKEKDEELDNLFRKGMEDPVNEAAFRDADWDAMEQMLNKGKKRPAIIFWLPLIGTAAALLLVFLGYLFSKTEVVKPSKQQMAAAHQTNHNTEVNPVTQQKKDTGTSGGPAPQAADSSKQQIKTPANYAGNPALKGHGKKSKSFFTLSSGEVRRNTAGDATKDITVNTGTIAATNVVKNSQHDTMGNATQQLIADNKVADKKDPVTTDDKKNLGTADNHKDAGKDDNLSKGKDNIAASEIPATVPVSSSKIKSAGKSRLGNRPQFAISVLASSDLNGVNSSFQQSKVGGNFGATFAVTFAKKWTITTGGVYAIKPYLTGFNNYHTTYQFKTQPASVYANCRVLDIPLNVNYQVYHKQANSITLGTGLSSYLMLREDYKFNYADIYNTTGPAGYSVVNKNRNILSVVNLDATYTHQINSKVGITLQPYLKIPLSNIGASQVRLQTTGVAVSLNWNINTSLKPK